MAWNIVGAVAEGEGIGMKGRWGNLTRRGRAKRAGPWSFMSSEARNIIVQFSLLFPVHLEVDDRDKPVWTMDALARCASPAQDKYKSWTRRWRL